MDIIELAREALLIQKKLNELVEKRDEIRDKLYLEMLKDTHKRGIEWADAELKLPEGRVIPQFTSEGWYIQSIDKYTKWCHDRGLTEMVECPRKEVSEGFKESGSFIVDENGEVVDGWVIKEVQPSNIYLKANKL